jgi:hypothetical protein
MARTQAGTPCPTCKSGITTVVAIVPRVVGDKVIAAGDWSCCEACYKEQWHSVYGEQFGGITYDEYIEDGERHRLLATRERLKRELAAIEKQIGAPV